MTKQPLHVSVVIPTRNRAAILADTIASVLAVDYPPDQFDLTVIDDGSTDDTAGTVKRFQQDPPANVQYVKQSPRGLNAARNNGVRQSAGEFILFLDDDVEVPPGLLSAYAAAAMRYPEALAFGGPVRVRIEGTRPPPRSCPGCDSLESLEAYDRGGTDTDVPWAIGANMAVRRCALERIGWFKEHLAYRQGNETEWFDRLQKHNLSVKYVAGAWLWHRRPSEAYGWWLVRKTFRKGRGRVRYTLEGGGQMPDPRQAFAQLLRWLLHFVRRGCFIGFLQATLNAGTLLGWLRWAAFRSHNPN